MLYTYGITQQGWAHKRNETVCQDAHKIVVDNNIAIAAVADGLGSELYSDIASSIAVDKAVLYCQNSICKDDMDEEILSAIEQAFRFALEAIIKRAKEDGNSIDQYDTTLSLCIMIDGRLYYGHSGDSGIIAYTEDGFFVNVTKQQRDNDGRVFPLFFGEEAWVISKFDKKVSSVILATDGIYELFFPIYIRKKEISIYTALLRYFADVDAIRINELGIEAVKKSREKYINNIPAEIVDDDKTLVVVIDTEVNIHRQPDAYYQEPDWAMLRREYLEDYNKKAYGNLNVLEDNDLHELL